MSGISFFRNTLLLDLLQQKKMVIFFSPSRVTIQAFQIMLNYLPGAKID